MTAAASSAKSTLLYNYPSSKKEKVKKGLGYTLGCGWTKSDQRRRSPLADTGTYKRDDGTNRQTIAHKGDTDPKEELLRIEQFRDDNVGIMNVRTSP